MLRLLDHWYKNTSYNQQKRNRRGLLRQCLQSTNSTRGRAVSVNIEYAKCAVASDCWMNFFKESKTSGKARQITSAVFLHIFMSDRCGPARNTRGIVFSPAPPSLFTGIRLKLSSVGYSALKGTKCIDKAEVRLIIMKSHFVILADGCNYLAEQMYNNP